MLDFMVYFKEGEYQCDEVKLEIRDKCFEGKNQGVMIIYVRGSCLDGERGREGVGVVFLRIIFQLRFKGCKEVEVSSGERIFQREVLGQ